MWGQRENIRRALTSEMAWSPWIPRGRASVQLKVVQAAPHAVDIVETSSHRPRPRHCNVEDEPVRVDDGGRTEVAAPFQKIGQLVVQQALGCAGGVVETCAVGLALDAFVRRLVARGDQGTV